MNKLIHELGPEASGLPEEDFSERNLEIYGRHPKAAMWFPSWHTIYPSHRWYCGGKPLWNREALVYTQLSSETCRALRRWSYMSAQLYCRADLADTQSILVEKVVTNGHTMTDFKRETLDYLCHRDHFERPVEPELRL